MLCIVAMNIHISKTIDDKRTVLRIAGRLQRIDLPALDNEIHLSGCPSVLDLSELSSAEEAGIEKLRDLASSGAQLRGISPYLRLLLGDGGS
jgi:hypothetical protein